MAFVPENPEVQWADLVGSLGLLTAGETLVLGDGAETLATSLNEGATVPCYWSGSVAVLSRNEDVQLEEAQPHATGLAEESFDAAILRHAWNDQAGLADVLAEAHRVLKPGGGVVVADLSADVLLEAPPTRYVHRLVTLADPQVGTAIEHRHCNGMQLTLEVVRAGFDDLLKYERDIDLGDFSQEGFLDLVELGELRGMEMISDPDERDRVIESVAAALPSVVPLGDVSVREPWYAVRGYKRSV